MPRVMQESLSVCSYRPPPRFGGLELCVMFTSPPVSGIVEVISQLGMAARVAQTPYCRDARQYGLVMGRWLTLLKRPFLMRLETSVCNVL